jgi:hypothetical protein
LSLYDKTLYPQLAASITAEELGLISRQQKKKSSSRIAGPGGQLSFEHAVEHAGAAEVLSKTTSVAEPLPSRQQEVELAHYPLSSFANYAENTQKAMSLVTSNQ